MIKQSVLLNLLDFSLDSIKFVLSESIIAMRLIDKFEKFLDKSAEQVGGYKILVVVALIIGYLLGSILS